MQEKVQYASFGTRFGAVILDGIILAVALAIIIPVIVIPVSGALKSSNGEAFGAGAITGVILMYLFGIPLSGVLYRAFFEASSLQGTPGKALIKIKVVNSGFERISFSQALIRNIVKIFSSAVFYIGYLVALRDEKCLTWHDMAARTFVVMK